jgi:hypothetical protein
MIIIELLFFFLNAFSKTKQTFTVLSEYKTKQIIITSAVTKQNSLLLLLPIATKMTSAKQNRLL